MHPDFEKNGYLLARNFLNNSTVELMKTYFDIKYKIIKYCEEERKVRGNLPFSYITSTKNGDAANSFVFYSDHLLDSIQLNYGQKVSSLLQLNLCPTYTLARIYEKGSVLLAHLDRAACEISSTLPIVVSDNRPSVIYIADYKSDHNNHYIPLDEIKQKGDYSKIELYPGDALFYKGMERYHWREALDTDYLIQFFLHYIQTDGQYQEWMYDKRPYVGFEDSYRDLDL